MVLIYMKDGECIEVEQAVRAQREEDLLVCRGAGGLEIASFYALDVETFTADPERAELLKDEVCEELTLIPGSGETAT